MSLQTVTVCVADDSPESADVLCEGLRQNQYEAVSASTGAQALEICTRGGIDLLLLDVSMPGIDGYEVCRRLKSDPKTRDIIVVFVTVKGSRANIERGYELGAADYITKPFNLPMVMVRVDAALREHRNKEHWSEPDEAAGEIAYTDPLTGLRNRSYLMVRLREEAEKGARYEYPISCVVFDVDEIRAMDEDLGPVSLDDLLVELAMIIKNFSRATDIVARYDGTVVAALLPHCMLDNAIRYADKILTEVGATTFADPSFPSSIQLSIGVACCERGGKHCAENLLGEAMRGLLQAKSCGEQRIVARKLAEA